MAIEKILVPIDFSQGSRAAVLYASAVAKAFHASFTLLHVSEPADALSGIVPGTNRDGDADDDRRTAMVAIRDLVNDMANEGAAPDHVLVETGYAVETILTISRDAYDLIVMGTHGRSGLKRLIMGSVAEAVIRRASCPVMTIHMPEAKQP